MKSTNNERADEGRAGDKIIVALCLCALVYISVHVTAWGFLRGFSFVAQ
jgi:hypothetical protein